LASFIYFTISWYEVLFRLGLKFKVAIFSAPHEFLFVIFSQDAKIKGMMMLCSKICDRKLSFSLRGEKVKKNS